MSAEDRASDAESERVQQAVRDLGSVRADPAFRNRLRHQFVSGAIAEDAGEAERTGVLPRRIGWVLVPTAVAAMAAVWLLVLVVKPAWELGAVTGTGAVAVSAPGQPEAEVELGDRARLAGLIRPGAQIRLRESGTVNLVAGNVILFQLDERAVLTIPSNPRKGEVMVSRLEAGELRIKTGPGFAGQGLSVRTTEGRTELRGTVVSVFKGGDFTCVCVLEGTARIGKNEADMEDVASGLRKVMFADERPSMVVAVEPHHLEGLTEFVEATQGVLE